jgi:hypothetical protein
MNFNNVFLSGQNVMYVGSGTGKTAWLLPTLAQLDLSMFAFERYPPNHDVSAQTLLKVREHAQVHNLKVKQLFIQCTNIPFRRRSVTGTSANYCPQVVCMGLSGTWALPMVESPTKAKLSTVPR